MRSSGWTTEDLIQVWSCLHGSKLIQKMNTASNILGLSITFHLLVTWLNGISVPVNIHVCMNATLHRISLVSSDPLDRTCDRLVIYHTPTIFNGHRTKAFTVRRERYCAQLYAFTKRVSSISRVQGLAWLIQGILVIVSKLDNLTLTTTAIMSGQSIG